MISSVFSFFWGLIFRHVLGICFSIFSILIIAILTGFINIDQIISFLNINEPLSLEIKEFYNKIAEAFINSFSTISSSFSSTSSSISTTPTLDK
jgi:hypothetical protein